MTALKVLAFFPVFNEESRIEPVLEGCRYLLSRQTIDELLVVDDGSTDNTPAILASDPSIKVLRHPNRLGAGHAIRTAYRYALDNGYDVLVLFAGNGKDNPADVAKLVTPILRDEADYVQGSRFLPGSAHGKLPPHRLVAMKLFTATYSLFLMRRFTDCTNGFRAYRTALLRDPRIQWSQEWLGHSYEIEFYMHYKATALGYRVKEVPVSKIYPYQAGQSYSKVRVRDWITNLKPLFFLRLGIRE